MQTWLNAQRTQAPCRPMYLSTNISMTTISSGGDGSPQCTMSKLSKGFKWSTLTNQGSPPPFFFFVFFNISQSHNIVVAWKVATIKKTNTWSTQPFGRGSHGGCAGRFLRRPAGQIIKGHDFTPPPFHPALYLQAVPLFIHTISHRAVPNQIEQT